MMTEPNNKFALPARYREISKSNIWNESAALTQKYNPIDLSSGCPDFPSPKHIRDALVKITAEDNVSLEQYARAFGHLRLVNVLSKLYSQLIGRQINPLDEILVTCGAYVALYATITGHIDVGDEVIIIEPFFYCYDAMVRGAGGTPKFIPLRPKNPSLDVTSSADWILDPKELEGMFNDKTKAIILNTPQNPIGKVFNQTELEMIADLCRKWNVLCISDEVYEWLVYKPNHHIRIATLPGMWERTITVGSAGKTFSITGWKIGWAYGCVSLMNNLYLVHQNFVDSVNTPIQEALAIGFEIELARLGEDDCYFISHQHNLKQKRDFTAKFFGEAGMKPIVPEGGYFMLTDWSGLESQIHLKEEIGKYKDFHFMKWMIKNIGIQGIPPSIFYSKENKQLTRYILRFCFVKGDETLDKAANALKRWKSENLLLNRK